MKKAEPSLTTKTKNEVDDDRRDVIRVSIPRSDIERFTKTTIQRNKRLFERLAKA